ncbi:MAG TPA: autotransporter-associated beta strand repeat-containing protein, partial [Saprospiraceae bacterium]|nr:autotransporter-associated beta strand repeat-containing protein [Saprospiraceae bacterium]
WDGTNAATYNYYLTSAPATNATTAMCQTFACNGSAFNTNNWSAASGSICNNSGMTNAFTPGSIATFCTPNGTGSSSAIVIAGMTATDNFILTAISGVINNQNNAVAILDVAAGKLMDCSTTQFGNVTTAGYIKNGEGSLAFAGGTYMGGFTLNAGIMICRAANSMGQNSSSGLLTLNAGTLAAATGGGSFFNKFSNILIGGDIQFGSVIAPAMSNVSISFNAPMNLGSTLRTFTLGSTGAILFSGIISNTGSGGITFIANSDGLGRFDITNTSNTFTGPININGTGGSVAVDVRFQADGSLGNASNTININGGRLATIAGTTYTINSSRVIHVGNTPGTAINVVTSGTLTYNGVIADLAGSTPGSWAKQGAATLSLGGVSTYTGATTINSGILKLDVGTNRLPTTTTVNLGQAANASLGTFNINGFSQHIGGLNSIPGNNISTNNNTVNSISAATLTLTGSGTYNYGDGSNANSGVITGAISLVKNGSGIQTLGDENTYTGTTTITNGELRFTPPTNIVMAGSLVMNGGILGTKSIAATRTLTFPSFDLSENSKIDLDTTNGHTITFTAAGTFTAGKTLTIYGWKGVAGMPGTKGKVFFGNSAAALTTDQLGQIQFNDGSIGSPGTNSPAAILSTGEVVGGVAGCGAVVLNANDSGSGSLRDVIAFVDPGCTITFDASLMGSTITLTSGEIEIDKNLTISGLGNVADLTLSGNSASRIFHVAAGKTLSLKNLSLKNSNAAAPFGGAVYVQGSLTLQNILFQNNFENGITPKGITVNSPGGVVQIVGTNVQVKQ